MTVEQFLARLGASLPFTFAADPQLGCINGSLRESTEAAISFARSSGRSVHIRRGCGSLLGTARPDGSIEAAG